MMWHDWSEFWYMGGYAFFVWMSFGVAALCLVLEVLWARHSWRQACQELRDSLES